MKRRLFWKILFGFWLTTIIITQGIWLMFAFLRPVPPGDSPNGMARLAIYAAASALRTGGAPAFNAEAATWPPRQRQAISLRPEKANIALGWTDRNSMTVADPAGAHYRISYNALAGRRERDHGPFDIPREVVFVSIIGGLIFSAILAWYLTIPIRRMRLGFGRLAQGDFATRLGPAIGRRRDEIADLAHDFDRMAERLEELIKARDRLLASVSHELRSPLARLQLAIGLARQDPSRLENSLSRIEGEAAKLDEMVGELLTLSKLESGAPRSEEYFDLAEIVKTVVADARFESAPLGVEIALESDPAPAEWICAGSGKLIHRALENIVRNAIRFSHAGQLVQVKLAADEQGRFAVTVTDQGPGVPEEMLACLFQPFVQASAGDGQGYGLGLAIAERAILAQGGAITARNRAPHAGAPLTDIQSGLVVVAILPRAGAAAFAAQ